MELLELVYEDQLNPKKVAATNGGEYHSPCPACGGKDRFIVWSVKNRYFCRQCNKTGDVIQYLRDFHGFSFKEACLKANIKPKSKLNYSVKKTIIFKPVKLGLPSHQWQLKASEFVYHCHQVLLKTPKAQIMLQKRGFSLETMQKFQIGWNIKSFFAEWIDEPPVRKIWLPKGIVIPSFEEEKISKIKIRTISSHYEKLPKYVETHGSKPAPATYCSHYNLPIVILESELDAMLLQQEAGDICSTIALGGASKKPDSDTHLLLQKSGLILFCLDYDEAGVKSFKWWKKQYKNLFIWVVPFEKSVGDAFKCGLDIKEWISLGINKFLELKNSNGGHI